MKLRKRMIAMFFLPVTMILGACQSEGGKLPESKEALQKPDDDVEVCESGSSEQKDTGNSAYHVTWEDMAEIQVVCMVTGSVPPGAADVEAAVNEITEQEINTHVSLTYIESGAYTQQINLMMSSGEPVDLIVTSPGGPASFNSMAAQGQLMDITGLLPEYAGNVCDDLGDLLKATSVEGRIYGIPCNKAFVTNVNIYMRTDVLEDLGLLEKAKNMATFSEYEEILEAVKNSSQWNYLAGIVSNGGYSEIISVANALMTEDKFEDCGYFDNLGDSMFLVGVDDDGMVYNFHSSLGYKKLCERARNWYDKGYIYKDSATTQEIATSLVRSDTAFSFFGQTEVGSEQAVSITCGMDMTAVPVVQLPISTSSVNKFVWAIPVSSKEPEAALTFFNMAYSDSRIANLLAWGIEGIDYEIKDNGNAGYISGNETPSYHTGDVTWPNKLITLPWENDSPDLRKQQQEARNQAEYSPYLGFICDTTVFSTELGAVSNAIEEYKPMLNAGVAPEGAWNDFVQKLELSGIDKIVGEYQAQLDTWKQEENK